MDNKTGVSMCGGIVNAKRPGLIPCDCKKCFHKRSPKGGGKSYCDYYKTIIDVKKKRCARYSGPEIKVNNNKKKKNTTSKAKTYRTCKKCGYYDFKASFCNSFNITISSTSTGMYCKNYKECRSSMPKKNKYKHSSSNKKWNKYKVK